MRFRAVASLEEVQVEKLDRICRKLRPGPDDHVLEIGTGWGAFALHAARNYGCKATTTKISREQPDESQQLFASAGGTGGRIRAYDETRMARAGTSLKADVNGSILGDGKDSITS